MGDIGNSVECDSVKLKADANARAEAAKTDVEAMILGAKPVTEP